MTEEIDPAAVTSKKQIVDSLPVPVPPKSKMKSRDEWYEMLVKAFTILTSSAAAPASADDHECRSFRSFISNELRNYTPRTRNKVLHEIIHSLSTRGILMFHTQSPPRPQHPRLRSHHSFLCYWFSRCKYL